jgi:hypothetical protein
MCTVSWIRSPDGYELLFNRDELKSRGEARPPRVGETDGVRWIGPVDPDAGGTWIAASERGLTVGVLNGSRAADEEGREWVSRGLLAPRLVACAGAGEVAAALRGFDLDAVRPFRLLAISPVAPAVVVEWDRRALAVDEDAEARVPLVSSAFDESAVGRARRAEFARLTAGRAVTLERLLEFHRSTTRGPNAFTVAMERPEAATRSLTRVTVTAEEVVMRYHAGRPDLPAHESTLALPRMAGAALPSRPAEPR